MGKIEIFQSTIDTQSDPIIVADAKGKILLANLAVQKVFACKSNYLIGQNINSFITDFLSFNSPKKLSANLKLTAKKINAQKYFSGKQKNGKKININVFSKIIAVNKSQLFLFTIFHNSNHKSDIGQLIANELKYRTIFENIQDLYFQTDLNGTILNVSPSVMHYSGYTAKEVIGKNVVNIYNNPSDRESFLKALTKNGKVFNYELSLKTKKGKIKYALVDAHIIFNSKGKAIYLEGLMRDNTERRKRIDELNKSNERHRALLNNLEVGVVIHAADTSIITSNPKASELLGLSIEQMQGKKAIDPEWHFIDEDKNPLALDKYPVNQIAKSKVQFKKFIGGVRRPKTKDTVWLIVNGFPVKDAEGEITEIVISFIDITELKRLELDINERKLMAIELIKAKEKAQESDKLKTAFLQNISHEIRTPMNAIVGFSKFLENPTLTEEEKKHHTAIIINSSNQLLSIVTDILTISALHTKQEKVSMTIMNINVIMDELYEIFNSLAEEQNTSLVSIKGLKDTDAEIYSDKTKITQILTNLISNAIKFTSNGKITFGYKLINKQLEFYVQDNGIGIKKEIQDKIFERFHQADSSINEVFGGTGLGLSISKGFLELLDGKIWVESEPNKGSTFYFTIPYEKVIVRKKEEPILKPIERQVTILVAEDEPINFMYLKLLFEGLKFKILHAKNGQQAIDLCQSHPEIEIVLMDIKMPVIDGYHAALAIKKFRPNLPILAQTGYALESEREKYKGDAFDDFIAKPIDGNTLKIKINKLLV